MLCDVVMYSALPDQAVCLAYEKALSSNAAAMQYLTGKNYAKGERGLSLEVLQKYGVGVADWKFVTDSGAVETHSALTFPSKRLVPSGSESVIKQIERVKIRSLRDKRYQKIHPKGSKAAWFGMDTVPLSADSVIITEGEFDAMAAFQGTGIPAISLPNGSNSLPVELLPELERFKTIYLWMDDDVAGQSGAQKFAPKLGVARVLIVHSRSDYNQTAAVAGGNAPKDANDCLRLGVDMKALLEAAAFLPHKQITDFSELRSSVWANIREPKAACGVQSKTMIGLNTILKGHRKGELTILTGPTGAGKTTVLSQISLVCEIHNRIVFWCRSNSDLI